MPTCDGAEGNFQGHIPEGLGCKQNGMKHSARLGEVAEAEEVVLLAANEGVFYGEGGGFDESEG